MVQSIEEYRQKDGTDILKVYCKPTKNFPEGSNYFYVDADAKDLVNQYCWYLCKSTNKNGVYVLASRSDGRFAYKFHKELAKKYSDNIDTFIDHINMIEIDNCDSNLNLVSNQQNQYNNFTKGYTYVKNFGFKPRVKINLETIYPYGQVKRTEDEACILQRKLETEWLQEQLGSDVYCFDIFKYRRGSLDILDLERTGQISHEETNYRHILKYADNAWYYLRYDLQDFFKEHHLPVPEYSLDVEGYMVDKITGKKLCPFYK